MEFSAFPATMVRMVPTQTELRLDYDVGREDQEREKGGDVRDARTGRTQRRLEVEARRPRREVLEESPFFSTSLGALVVGDCLEVLRGLEAESVDLVVTDIVMPSFGGPELVSRLQQRAPAVRVLYMSGYTEQSAAHRAGIGSGVPLLQKPFTAAEFVRQVRRVLDH